MTTERDEVWIPPGSFRMGSDVHYPEEAPAHEEHVDGLWMQRSPVTNDEFAAFVADTGYTTVAERSLDPADYPGAPPENLVPGSLVFTMTPGPVDLRHLSQWWTWRPGASWGHPEGPRSSLARRGNHPVVHIAYEDAEAYVSWAGLSLPTEAEWERAARGGREGDPFVWGTSPETPGERLANYWHGDFPWRSEAGYGATSPVGSFAANGYGLHDMAGNVWEWTSDWWSPRHADQSGCCGGEHAGRPRPQIEGSYDPAQPQFRVPRKVIKGGSYLCADDYCQRYRPAARRPQMIDTGMSHIGFRCVRRTAN